MRFATIRLGLFLSLLFFASNFALAECIPGADPCAPKKKMDEWDKAMLFGFNLSRGNSETVLLNIAANAKKETAQDLWDFGASYNYGEDKQKPEEQQKTRNDVRANGSYNYLFTDRMFGGLGAKFLYDEIADVDYRVNADPTIGYYLLKDNTFKFRLEGGPSYTFEKVGGVSDDFFSPRVADRFDWAISCTSKVYQQAEIYFDISDSDNYIVNAEAGVEAALSTNLALVVAVRDSYDNLPAADKDKNDLAVISSIKVAL